jgi:hypothetical protein
VIIKGHVEPYSILNLRPNAGIEEVKVSFRNLIGAKDRQQRALASISYAIIGSLFKVRKLPSYFKKISNDPLICTFDCNNPIVKVYIGDCAGLRSLLKKDRNICDLKCENSMSLLYIAARSGFRDIATTLLKFGCNVNADENGSTPLHAAAYFGHALVVELLISNGASVSIKNKSNKTALDEARTPEITKMLEEASNDQVATILRQLQEEKLDLRIEHLSYNQQVVGYRVVRNVEGRSDICKNFIRCWHGTRRANIISIFKYGLRLPGEVIDGTSIKIGEFHIPLGITYGGRRNWAKAVFASPTVTYAGLSSYSDRYCNNDGTFCLLIEAGIRPGKYETHQSTISFYEVPANCDPNVEYRIKPGKYETCKETSDSRKIVQISSEANIVVLAVTLLDKRIVQSAEISESERRSLICGTEPFSV